MQSSIAMIIEEVKRLSNIHENRVPSVLLFETLFKAEEMHKQEIIDAQSYAVSNADMTNNKGYFDCDKYYSETFKKD